MIWVLTSKLSLGSVNFAVTITGGVGISDRSIWGQLFLMSKQVSIRSPSEGVA